MPLLIALVVAVTVGVSSAAAQQAVSGYNIVSRTQDRIGENHLKLTGDVEIEQGDSKLYADEVEFFIKEDRVVATGNVVFSQGNNRIAADRADFNPKTRLGTFYNATGIANIQPRQQMAAPGGFTAPQLTGQETDVYFFGEKVEKIASKKYKITNGGFTTCVQPTPRWDLSADTVVLNIDHYTLLRQAILKVKGVPMLYVPILYYPTKEEDRATGFLLPTYGSSSVRGQAIHNAFFWAINRSQDATIFHDWYSKAGQGAGTEYRYNMGAGADGTLRAYLLNETVAEGGSDTLSNTRSFELRGGANQPLPAGFRARARVDYFSSIRTMQTFNANIFEATRNQRSFGGNVVGAWRTYSLNATLDRNETFYDQTNSVVAGNLPRVTISRNERPLFGGSPVYFSATGDVARLDRESRRAGVVDDSSLTRLDFTPQIRYPFKRWQWFTVNSSFSWRDTYYTRSRNPETSIITEDDVNRGYFTAMAHAVGPVFNKVWDTPGSSYAERFKHTIEPFVTLQRTSAIDNYNRIIQTDGDVLGNTTNATYGLNNRFYAKRRIGQTSQAQEIASVEIRQTYYTDGRSARIDPSYSTSQTGTLESHLSPVYLAVRTAPSAAFNATLSAEFDSRYREMRTMSVAANYNWSNRLQSTIGWTQRYFIEELPGFNDRNALPHSLNVSTNVRTSDNRLGSVYSFYYDITRSTMVQQRIQGFYNAQCCGIAFEYQTFNVGGISPSGLPADHRFFLSFSLAGLGNFSPFNGAMGAVPR